MTDDMSQEYDVIDEVKSAKKYPEKNDEEIENAPESAPDSLRNSPVPTDDNQNHLSAELLKSELDAQLVQNSSVTSDEQTQSHISGLEFLESVRKEDKARKKEKKHVAKDRPIAKKAVLNAGKFAHPTENIPWRNVPRPFHDRTCSRLGLAMLALSLALISLGGYALARGASLACLGAGLWAGAGAAICGGIASLWTAPANLQNPNYFNPVPKGISSSVSEANLANSVVNAPSGVGSAASYGIIGCGGYNAGVGKAMAALLVASLISLAMSTLALALTGIGVLRDAHRLAAGTTTDGAIWAGGALVFCLVLHCGCCLRAGYYAALSLRIRRCQEKQRLKDLAGERGLYVQQQAWLTAPIPKTPQQLTLPKTSSTLSNREGLVRMWLGRQGGRIVPMVPPNVATIQGPPPPHCLMPQMTNTKQRSCRSQEQYCTRLRPPSDPRSLPFDYVKNVVNNLPRHASVASRSQNMPPDLTYNGLDRAIADAFINTYNSKQEIQPGHEKDEANTNEPQHKSRQH